MPGWDVNAEAHVAALTPASLGEVSAGQRPLGAHQ